MKDVMARNSYTQNSFGNKIGAQNRNELENINILAADFVGSVVVARKYVLLI